MEKVKVILGTYNSQPVGASETELEEAYQTYYKPFLSAMNKLPSVPVVLYYCGILLEWLERKHPEFLVLMNDMISRRQLEILGGAFYEPVLSLISNTDKLGQIELLTTHIRKKFGKRPRGAWVPEKVWEPGFTLPLCNSGLDFIFLEDRLFHGSGLIGADLFRPIITEDQGKTLQVLPISVNLFKYFYKKDIQTLVDTMLKYQKDYVEQDLVFTFLFNGECLGDHVRDFPKAIDLHTVMHFIELLQSYSKQIEILLPRDCVRAIKPGKKAYFNCSSYSEMMKWPLDSPAAKSFEEANTKLGKMHMHFASGGFFRQFLTKYEESNRLYSKMMYTHLLVNQIRGDRARKKCARSELWKGQSHHAYWHGRIPGIYNNDIRKAAYKNLIEAEKITRERGIFKTSVVATDFDMDGYQEYLYQGQYYNAYFHQRGACLFELDHIRSAWNYLDTMARYKEFYHSDDTEEQVYDTYTHDSFLDHLSFKPLSLKSLKTRQFTQDFPCLAKRIYDMKSSDRERKTISYKTSYESLDASSVTAQFLEKQYKLSKNEICLRYHIQNRSKKSVSYYIQPEINFSLPKASSSILIGKHNYKENDEAEVKNIDCFEIEDLENKVKLEFEASKQCETLFMLPVISRSKVYGQKRKDYQSTMFFPQYKVELKPEDGWRLEIILKIHNL